MHIIEHFPGIRYKELMHISRLSYGTISYHLRILEREGLIQVERGNKVTRFYPLGVRDFERIIMRMSRNKTRRTIIYYLTTVEQDNLENIANYVNKARSTISWHMRSLYKAGIININKVGKTTYYSLKSRGEIIRILTKYSTCFIDNRSSSKPI